VFILGKKIFSRTSRPISIKLGTNNPCVNRILNCSNKGPGSFQGGNNHKNAKISEVNGLSLKKFFLDNH
jgi:hypothetical protein